MADLKFFSPSLSETFALQSIEIQFLLVSMIISMFLYVLNPDGMITVTSLWATKLAIGGLYLKSLLIV